MTIVTAKPDVGHVQFARRRSTPFSSGSELCVPELCEGDGDHGAEGDHDNRCADADLLAGGEAVLVDALHGGVGHGLRGRVALWLHRKCLFVDAGNDSVHLAFVGEIYLDAIADAVRGHF